MNNSNFWKKDRVILYGFYALCFVFFCFFFINIHPIVVGDVDDFYYTYMHRCFVPSLKCFNPSKVFPECVKPVIASFSAYFLNPFFKDLFYSLTVGYAITVSTFILLLLLALKKYFLKERSYSIIFLLTLLFLLCHFWIFRSRDSDNAYMFHASDMNCYIDYFASSVLNCMVFLMLIEPFFCKNRYENLFCGSQILRSSILVILFYFAIFSNLLCNIIPVSFMVIKLSLDIFPMKKILCKEGLKGFFIENKYLLLYTLMWVISALFEFNGERSSHISKEFEFSSILKCLEVIGNVLSNVNKCFAIFLMVVFLFASILNIKSKNKLFLGIALS